MKALAQRRGAARCLVLGRKRSRTFAEILLMRDLYKRLRRVGFDEEFVRKNLLPDWWEDSLASVPSNRALAEASISRMLGFPVVALRDQARELELPAVSTFRLKRSKKTRPSEIAPALLLAFQAAASILRALDTAAFTGLVSAEALRKTILRGRQFIDLSALIDCSWAAGIPVFHLAELPKASKKFAGMAVFCEGRPAIVLASGHDSPAWVAYQLAHELGHIFRGHVTPDSKPLVDGEFDGVDDEEHEDEANRFACEVLTGDPAPDLKAVYGLTAPRLVDIASRIAREHSVDPGVYALVYGKNAGRMGVAQNALKLMGLDRGARTIISNALLRHLPEDLPEPTERFVSLVTTAA
jgi:hypothetical protein